MTVRRKIFGTSVAIAVALTISAPSSAFAQGGGAAPAAPAPGGQGVGGGEVSAAVDGDRQERNRAGVGVAGLEVERRAPQQLGHGAGELTIGDFHRVVDGRLQRLRTAIKARKKNLDEQLKNLKD